jgi:hypothetical protein
MGQLLFPSDPKGVDLVAMKAVARIVLISAILAPGLMAHTIVSVSMDSYLDCHFN